MKEIISDSTFIWTSIAALFAALLAIGGAYIQTKEKLKEKKDADAANTELIELQRSGNKTGETGLQKITSLEAQNRQLQDTINRQKDELIGQGKKLQSSTEENLKLSTELYNSSIGKNSMPIIEFMGQTFLPKDVMAIRIYNDGNYPVNGIKIFFLDPFEPSKSSSSKEEGLRNFYEGEKVVEVGNLAPHASRDNVYRFIVPRNYNMQITQFSFQVVWQSGEYECHGYFLLPGRKIPEGFPKRGEEGVNKLTYTVDHNPFTPKPFPGPYWP